MAVALSSRSLRRTVLGTLPRRSDVVGSTLDIRGMVSGRLASAGGAVATFGAVNASVGRGVFDGVFAAFARHSGTGIISAVVVTFGHIGRPVGGERVCLCVCGSKVSVFDVGSVLTIRLQTFTTAADFRRCVRYHMACVEFANLSNTILSASMCAHIALTGAVIIAEEFHLKVIDPRTRTIEYAVAMAAVLVGVVQLCYPCYFGSQVHDQSERLRTRLWSGSWWDTRMAASKSFRSRYLILGAMLNHPIEPQAAGGLIKVTLPTWVSVSVSVYYVCYVMI